MKKNVKFSVIGLMSIGLLLGACKKDDSDDTTSCSTPSSLITDATAANSITISWTANSGSSWNIEYGMSGFTAGSGTTMTVTGTSATIDNLESNTSYDFYVQADCGDATSSWAGPLTVTTNNPIVGEWGTYDPSIILTSLGTDSVYSEFYRNNTYHVTSYDTAGAAQEYEGSYTTSSEPNSEGIYSITVYQTSPSNVTSEGIYKVFPANPDSMWYEIAQTDPSITGVTPPTAEDGFGSTSGGAYGTALVQKYLRAK